MSSKRSQSRTLYSKENLGYVKFSRANSTLNKQTPEKKKSIYSSNKCVVKILRNLKSFKFDGYLDKKSCIFIIDSGSDVTISNRRFINFDHHEISLDDKKLKYLTGKNVPVLFKTIVSIDSKHYSVKIIIICCKY